MTPQVLKKMKKILDRSKELDVLLQSPEISVDNKLWLKFDEEKRNLEMLSNNIEKYFQQEKQISILENQKSSDPDLQILFDDELENLKQVKENLELEILTLMLPKDETSGKKAIFEISAMEQTTFACEFCKTLYQFYCEFCKLQNWQIEIEEIETNSNELMKKIVFEVSGNGSYDCLQFESGQCQAISEKGEKANAMVMVFPEVQTDEFKIDAKDLRIDVFHSNGAGGQNVNKVESAIRITHLPTNIVVTCQDERSQLRNKERATKTIYAKVFNHYEALKNAEKMQIRKKVFSEKEKRKCCRLFNFETKKISDKRMDKKFDLLIDDSKIIDSLINLTRFYYLSKIYEA